MSPLPKICETHPAMMKPGTALPYLNKIQKISESSDTSMTSAYISIFSPEISKFCYIKKYRYRLHFVESLKIVLINMVTILMVSAKLATRGLLKIKVF